jgi:hypothetical protein
MVVGGEMPVSVWPNTSLPEVTPVTVSVVPEIDPEMEVGGTLTA